MTPADPQIAHTYALRATDIPKARAAAFWAAAKLWTIARPGPESWMLLGVAEEWMRQTQEADQ